MAEIVQTLFGISPESYQQQQSALADQRALQYAKLDPFQQANYAIGRGAYGLAGAIGGALGGQDPELQRITMRQQIAGQIDYNDDASMQQAITALSQAGDSQGAMQLQQIRIGQKAKLASIGKDEALARQAEAAAKREKGASIPTDIQVAQEISFLQEKISQLTNLPASPERDLALRLASGQLSQLERLTTKEPKDIKDLRFGVDREAIAEEMYELSFAELTKEQKAAVNKRVEEESKRKAEAGASKIVLPGQPVPPKDWMDFTTKILSGDPTMVRTSTIISDAPNAIDIIRSSTTNDISAAALPGALARLTGEGKNMSNQDVARFARTGGLDDRLVQDAVKFFTGRTTSVKKEQAEQFATSLYRGALLERKKKLSAEAEQFGYLESPNYKTALRQIDEQLNQINAPGAPASDLAAQAAAELARRKAAKAK